MGLRGAMLLVVVAALGALGPPPVAAAPSTHAHASAHLRAASHREEALLRLQKALGLPEPVLAGGDRHEAPEFMLELQRRVAHPDGVLRASAAQGDALPHGARIVRSFFEQEPGEGQLLRFNLSRLGASERVLGAELRIFRLRRPRAPLLLRVYQVEEGRGAGPGAAADEHRLLGVQAAAARAAPAWHTFNVLGAVRAWLAGDAPNLGLMVTAATLDGSPARAPAFARRGGHGAHRQPLLVLYDGEEPAPLPARAHARDRHHHAGGQSWPESSARESAASENAEDISLTDDYDGEEDYEEEQDDALRVSENDFSSRRRARTRRDAPWTSGWRRRRRHGLRAAGTLRATLGNELSPNVSAAAAAAAAAVLTESMCSRHDLWVDFEEIGWSSWILSPPGYNAYQCVGECPYPLGPALAPTNHATVQSIVHQLQLQEDARPPCCTPQTLDGLSLLFADEEGNVILKLFEDMVASTCGCQ